MSYKTILVIFLVQLAVFPVLAQSVDDSQQTYDQQNQAAIQRQLQAWVDMNNADPIFQGEAQYEPFPTYSEWQWERYSHGLQSYGDYWDHKKYDDMKASYDASYGRQYGNASEETTAEIKALVTHNQVRDMMIAIQQNNLAKLQQVIAQGADVNGLSKSGWSALAYAVNKMKLKFVNYLLAHGANVKARYTKDQITLPILAIGSGGDAKTVNAIVDTLLSHGADINAQDANGETVLFWWDTQDIHTRSKEIAQHLINKGASFDIKDKNGLSMRDRLRTKN